MPFPVDELTRKTLWMQTADNVTILIIMAQKASYFAVPISIRCKQQSQKQIIPISFASQLFLQGSMSCSSHRILNNKRSCVSSISIFSAYCHTKIQLKATVTHTNTLPYIWQQPKKLVPAPHTKPQCFYTLSLITPKQSSPETLRQMQCTSAVT